MFILFGSNLVYSGFIIDQLNLFVNDELADRDHWSRSLNFSMDDPKATEHAFLQEILDYLIVNRNSEFSKDISNSILKKIFSLFWISIELLSIWLIEYLIHWTIFNLL